VSNWSVEPANDGEGPTGKWCGSRRRALGPPGPEIGPAPSPRAAERAERRAPMGSASPAMGAWAPSRSARAL
jgi:hypothetical protein